MCRSYFGNDFHVIFAFWSCYRMLQIYWIFADILVCHPRSWSNIWVFMWNPEDIWFPEDLWIRLFAHYVSVAYLSTNLCHVLWFVVKLHTFQMWTIIFKAFDVWVSSINILCSRLSIYLGQFKVAAVWNCIAKVHSTQVVGNFSLQNGCACTYWSWALWVFC